MKLILKLFKGYVKFFLQLIDESLNFVTIFDIFLKTVIEIENNFPTKSNLELLNLLNVL